MRFLIVWKVFRMVFCIPFLIDFQLAFSRKFSSILLFFDSARKWPTSDFCNTLRVKTNIFQGARLRRRNGEGEEATQKQHKTQHRKIVYTCYFFLLFSCRQALQQKCSQNDVPEALRDPPGDPLGASGDTLGGPRRPQEAPRATQEGPRSRPGPPRSGPKRPQKPASASGGLRGAILEPFWPHFGASGGRFSSLRRLIFERPGGHFLNHLWSFVQTRSRAIQEDSPKRNFRNRSKRSQLKPPGEPAQRAS